MFLQNACTRFNETYHVYALPSRRDTDNAGPGHRQHVTKIHFSGGGILIEGSPSKTVQFAFE